MEATVMDRGSIGKRITQVRRARRLTQRQLGQMLGLNAVHICNLEDGRHTPDAARLEQIAAVLAVPVAALFEPPGAKMSRRCGAGRKAPPNIAPMLTAPLP
jgi:transcriptional regulator with XRE-family HTH domain